MNKTPFPHARILIVDDQASNIAVLEKILRDAGYQQIRTLQDSKRVIEVFEETKPDIVLLDLLMPGIDGFEVLATLRSRIETESFLPVIVLTADGNPTSKRRALAAGTRDFLTKPFDLTEVLLRIHNHLETRFLHLRETKRAGEEIRLLELLIDQANDAIVMLDPENRITFWNHGAELTYGWTALEAKGRRFQDLFPDPSIIFEVPLESVRTINSWSGYLHLTRKDGGKIQVSSRLSTLMDTSGVKAILLIGTDVTEAKRLESQAHQAQRLSSIGTLAGGIAHDIGNALNPVAAAAGMLRYSQEDLGPEVLEFLDITDLCVGRATDLLRKVLAFARGAPPQQKVLDLQAPIDNILGMLRKTIDRSIEIDSSIPSDLWSVNIDPTELDQVLMNLCLNARDAMAKGGTLRVAAENLSLTKSIDHGPIVIPPGDYVQLTITDSGTGIAPDILERIFDPFFTTKAEKGTGLGLSVCHGIIQNQGGYLGVSSTLGGGTTFSVYLLATPPRTAHANRDVSVHTRCQCSEAHPSDSRYTVLVVDDDEAIRKACIKILSGAGYKALEATGGAQALEIVSNARHQLQVVITDLYMPQLDGATLLSALAQQAPEIYRIAMSGHPIADLPSHAFLRKPFTPQRLLEVVKQALREEATL